MRSTSRIHAFLILTALCSPVSACAIEPIAGGRLAKLPASPEATYRVTRCTVLDKHKRVNLKQPVWYYLGADDKGPLLFEKSARGQVVAFENRWTDKRGRHALVWVYGGPYGYHVIRPWEPSKPAVRLLWRRRDLREENGLWQPRPKAMPYARCPMELHKPSTPRPAPRPPAKRPPAKSRPSRSTP